MSLFLAIQEITGIVVVGGIPSSSYPYSCKTTYVLLWMREGGRRTWGLPFGLPVTVCRNGKLLEAKMVKSE
jgi:hypothetical protein